MDHAVALKPWIQIRESLAQPPILFTLDHHTDTHEAFISHACKSAGSFTNPSSWETVAEKCLAEIDLTNEASVESALQKLRNDEQIRTAIRLGVLDAALVLSYDERFGTSSREWNAIYRKPLATFFAKPSDVAPRPHTYDVPRDRVFYLPNFCYVGCTAAPHDDECTRPHYDQAIESVFLSDRLGYADEMIQGLGQSSLLGSSYILDIDLDYFHTRASLQPKDTRVFDDLARQAVAITIALEPKFVDYVKLDAELTADDILAAVFEHLERSLGTRSECN